MVSMMYDLDNYIRKEMSDASVEFDPAKSFNWMCSWDPMTQFRNYSRTIVSGFTPPEPVYNAVERVHMGERRTVVFNKTFRNEFSVKYLLDSGLAARLTAYRDVLEKSRSITDSASYFDAYYVENKGREKMTSESVGGIQGRVCFGLHFINPSIIDFEDDEVTYDGDGSELVFLTVKYAFDDMKILSGVA